MGQRLLTVSAIIFSMIFLHGSHLVAANTETCKVLLKMQGSGYLSGQVLGIDHGGSGDMPVDVVRMRIELEPNSVAYAGIFINHNLIQYKSHTLTEGTNILIASSQLAPIEDKKAYELLESDFRGLKPELFTYVGTVEPKILK